jgi:polysaccharide biosynthesis/export protein
MAMKTNILKFRNFMIGLASIMIVASSCVNQKNVRMLQANSKAASEYTAAIEGTYRLKAGDHLYIKVYSVDPKTSKFFQSDFPELMSSTYLYLNSYKVDEQGYVSFSFVDKMYVKGLTISETKTLIQNTLNQYFKDATVFVKLVNYQISVLGEVRNPGSFTVDQEQINIFQALSLANGTTDFSMVDKITLVRQTQTGSDVHYLDLSKADILTSEYFYLMPNDIVYVEPRGAKSWVYSSFPYTLILSFLTIGLSVAVLFDVANNN